MIGVIADDLTGCGDVGLYFANYGLRTVIQVIPQMKTQTTNENIEAIIINTESRFDSPEVAYSKVKSVCQWFKDLKIKKIYKKIDSTLRGNIGSEIDALFDELKIENLPFCAAFPGMGRTTEKGYHYVNNRLITDTEFAIDPRNPITESHIPTLLKTQSPNYDKIIVYDVKTQDDLKNVAVKVTDSNSRLSVVCGAAGLAEEVVKFWVTAPRFSSQKESTKQGSVLIISGSASSVTYEQIDELVSNYDIINVPIDFEEQKTNISGKISPQNSMVIYPAKGSGKVDSERIIIALVQLATRLCEKGLFKNLILIGGDTSFNICKALKILTLKIVSSVLPGIAFCKEMDKGYNIILKPGSFGDNKALIKCYEFLGGQG